jgi:hypothetical protein
MAVECCHQGFALGVFGKMSYDEMSLNGTSNSKTASVSIAVYDIQFLIHQELTILMSLLSLEIKTLTFFASIAIIVS